MNSGLGAEVTSVLTDSEVRWNLHETGSAREGAHPLSSGRRQDRQRAQRRVALPVA